MTDCSCACTPIEGSDRCIPQFGAIVSLPLAVGAGQPGTVTVDEPGYRQTAEYDWNGLIPGLTGRATSIDQSAGGVGFAGAGIGWSVGGLGCGFISIQFDMPVQLRRLRLGDFDGPGSELLWSVSPPVDSVSSNFRNNQCTNNHGGCRNPQIQPLNAGCIRSTGNNQSGFAFWNAPYVQGVSWGVSLPAGLGVSFPTIDVQAPLTPIRAVAERCNDGTFRWTRVDNGVQLTAAQVATLQECG